MYTEDWWILALLLASLGGAAAIKTWERTSWHWEKIEDEELEGGEG